VFQAVRLNGRAAAGALRNTLHVPAISKVGVALDVGEAARRMLRRMLHCHHMPHLAAGAMTEVPSAAPA